jgi:hypothetical protein
MAELRARYTALNSDLWPPVDADLAVALARFSSENSTHSSAMIAISQFAIADLIGSEEPLPAEPCHNPFGPSRES